MLTLPLEPTDDRANPVFKDAEGCAQWLKQLQLTNLQLAHSLLLTQVTQFTRFAVRGLERLNTLELLRDTVHYVQNDYAKKLLAKPLPLNEHEMIIFFAIVHLWQAMAIGYQRCLQAYMAGDKQLDNQAALLCQRCLLYSGLAIAEHLRTGHEFDAKLWHQLHALYGFAEEQALQQQEVPEPLNTSLPSSSCHHIYVKTLLTCYGRPAELSRSQLQMVDFWLAAWSNVVPIELSYALSKGDAPPLAVDIAGRLGLQPVKLVTHSPGMRYVAMVPLSKLIRVKTIMLQQGKTPSEVELGDHGNTQECIELLTFLHQCWCEDYNTRFTERTPSSQHAELCYKPENIYAHLSGRAFKQTAPSSVANAIAQKQIETYGRVLQDSPPPRVGTGFPLETWQFENESILGAKLLRVDTQGERLTHKQLLALRVGDAEVFMLGVISWVTMTRTGQLRIGVRYLPGIAHAIGLHMNHINPTTGDNTAPGVLLQAVPALLSPPSLIIPRNWFQPGRVVEIQQLNGEKQNATMGFSVERGIDYERVSFTLGQ
jgi:hypothetical protein